eukprot:3477830-Pleurochrysis_carterae.AAC.1
MLGVSALRPVTCKPIRGSSTASVWSAPEVRTTAWPEGSVYDATGRERALSSEEALSATRKRSQQVHDADVPLAPRLGAQAC